MIFTRVAKAQRSASTFALAIALATGAAIGVTALESPAYAQKKPKAAKAKYSKEFVGIYQPLVTETDVAGADPAVLKSKLPALHAVTASEDEKLAAGQITYNIGIKASDISLQRQGLDFMLQSGKLDPTKIGQIYFAAGQLALNAKDYPAARTNFEKAGAAGHAADEVQVMLAETYFSEENINAGADILEKAIAAKEASGQPVPDAWIKRGLSVAYNADNGPAASKFASLYVKHYSSVTSWGDAIAIQRNLFNYDEQQLLDLMRLAQRTGSLRNERDYVDYISAADARRLPGEVTRIIDAGIAAGMLKANDVFVSDARTQANGRLKADRADLPGLERDARLGSSTAVTAMAAGDAFLSYGEAAKAEEFYTASLTKSGVDATRALTRLGIAQFDQGKYAEAQATFAKVTGPRQPIAQLWAVRAAEKAK